MKEHTEYSRLIQNVYSWNQQETGSMIGLLHACVEAGITTFDVTSFQGEHSVGSGFGTALSESGLSRDEIQLVARVGEPEVVGLEEQVDELLLELGTDYIDLLLLGQTRGHKPLLAMLEKMFTQGKLHEIGGLGLPVGSLKRSELQRHIFQTSFMTLSLEILKRMEDQADKGEEQTLFTDWSANHIDHFSQEAALSDIQDIYQLTYQQLLLVWLLQHPVNMHLVVEGRTQAEIKKFGKLKEVRLHPFDWQQISLIFTG